MLTQEQKNVADARVMGLASYAAYDTKRDEFDAEFAANGMSATARTLQTERNALAEAMASELGI